MPLDLRLGIIRVANRHHLVPTRDEELPHQLRHVGIVIHYEDARNAPVNQKLTHG